MRILVTGASGFVGPLLISRLLQDGHLVRAFGRDPARVRAAIAAQRRPPDTDDLEIVRGDALTGEGLQRALADIEVGYYLIHSMERPRRELSASFSAAPPFAERERIAAETFAGAALTAGVTRIVYLGGLQAQRRSQTPRPRSSSPGTPPPLVQPPGSRHLSSRAAVERILLAAVPDSVALRASIIIGARSRSFRLLVHLLERLPILTLPAWRKFHTQPIDGRDIIEMLASCATAAVAGRSLDVGGPEVLSYEEMIARIAELMLVNRPSLGLGVSVTPVTARLVAAIAEEDPELVIALMQSLQGDLLPANDHAAELLNVELHSFDSAVEHALGEWEESEPLAAR
jgi:uncharacterized protein YbjT (DUF2867 family)